MNVDLLEMNEIGFNTVKSSFKKDKLNSPSRKIIMAKNKIDKDDKRNIIIEDKKNIIIEDKKNNNVKSVNLYSTKDLKNI